MGEYRVATSITCTGFATRHPDFKNLWMIDRHVTWHTKAMRQFILNFDQGYYPDLIDDQAQKIYDTVLDRA